MGPHMTPKKVYKWSKLQKLVSNKIRILLNFIKSTKFFYNISELFVLFLFYNVHKEKMLTIEIGDGREAPWKPGYFRKQLFIP